MCHWNYSLSTLQLLTNTLNINISPKKVKTRIHVWHLELTSRKAKIESKDSSYQLHKIENPFPEFNRFLYMTVGESCNWYLRRSWSWQQWQENIKQEMIETWVAHQGATPIGYFELEKQTDGSTKIAYFGLIPQFIGQGLGKALLEDAIKVSWSTTQQRISLHTCTLDHPSALPNYINRGFKIFKEEDFEDMIPSKPLQPWEGADKAI